jgi:TonB family protein
LLALPHPALLQAKMTEKWSAVVRLLAILLLVTGLAFAGDPPPPVIRSMEVPIYPQLAIQARVQGSVTLDVVVGVGGDVEEAKATSGHQLLTAISAENVKTWRFAPSPDGKPVKLTITFDYRIEGKEIQVDNFAKVRSVVRFGLPSNLEIIVPPARYVYFNAGAN